MVVARGEGRSLGVSETVSTIYGGLLLVMGGGRRRGRFGQGVCCQDLQTLNLFKTKSTHFTTLFKTRNHFTCTRPLFISICKDIITYYYVQQYGINCLCLKKIVRIQHSQDGAVTTFKNPVQGFPSTMKHITVKGLNPGVISKG